MTLEFVNHLRLGSTLACGISRDWKEAALGNFTGSIMLSFAILEHIQGLDSFFAELQSVSDGVRGDKQEQARGQYTR